MRQKIPSSACASPATSSFEKVIAVTSHPTNLAAISDPSPKSLLRIVIVGHVDHGKSTLIGRLLQETGGISAAKIDALKAMSSKRGMPFELSFLLDSLQAERDQGITIDTSEIRFRTADRDVALIDAPGHTEFLRNMITGASRADAALLLIDAAEGVREQTRRHAYLLHLLGIRQVAVILNKMDRVGFDEQVYKSIASEISTYLENLGLLAAEVVPISAREGDGVAALSRRLSWYRGRTVLQAIDTFSPARPAEDLALRLPVQAVYKFDDRRIVAGRIETGRLTIGDELVFQPSGKTAIVHSIESWPTPEGDTKHTFREAGHSVGITLDREIFVERGEIIATGATRPKVARSLRARIFWLADEPLYVGASLNLRLATASTKARIAAIHNVIDPGQLSQTVHATVGNNQVAELELGLFQPLGADLHTVNPKTGRIVLEHAGRIAGGGLILSVTSDEAPLRPANRQVTPVASTVSVAERSSRHGHEGAVLWFTGLPGSGKSTIARSIERRIFDLGGAPLLLDGDTMRAGLNNDLGFANSDRTENIRRLAEVSSLLARNGSIAITAAISPVATDRAMARELVGERFFEIHVATPLAVCEERDPKGLYKRARAGEIKGFTGVDAIYEEPVTPDLTLRTDELPLEASVARVVDLLRDTGILKRTENDTNTTI
jgi:bifunctional enzyme CysN/CysC